MARARLARVPRGRAGGPAALNRPLRRWLVAELRRLRPAVAASAARCRADRYRKHFGAFGHACLLLFHGLGGGRSLRQSYAALADCPSLLAFSGLAAPDGGPGVSFSQVAASSTSRPAALLAGLVPALAERVRRLGGAARAGLPPDLRVLDSTVLRLGLRRAPRLARGTGSPRVSGVRVQVGYTPALDLPEHLLATDTRTNDAQGLGAAILGDPARLAALRGWTLAVDLGYYSHRRFARLLRAGVHLVSRLHPQAAVRAAQDRPVQPPLAALPAGRVAVLADRRVLIGSPNNRAGAPLPPLRLVIARVEPRPAAARRGAGPVEYRLLTDRWDVAAGEVVQLYLWRWEVELFPRWLESHAHLPRLLGYSRNAVELTVWLAVVVHLLALLAAHALGLGRRSPALLARLAWALAHLTADLAAAAPTAHRLTLPGWPPLPDG
jgi:hypothetical protein